MKGRETLRPGDLVKQTLLDRLALWSSSVLLYEKDVVAYMPPNDPALLVCLLLGKALVVYGGRFGWCTRRWLEGA